MKNRPARPRSSTVIHALTLLYFFHFSTLNNGYTFMLSDGVPAKPKESISMVEQLLGEWHRLMSPSQVLELARQSSDSIVRFTLQVKRVGSRLMRPALSRAGALHDGISDQPWEQRRLSAQKENYLQQEQENGIKGKKRQLVRPGVWSIFSGRALRVSRAGQERMKARSRPGRDRVQRYSARLQLASDDDEHPDTELARRAPSSSDSDRRMIFFALVRPAGGTFLGVEVPFGPPDAERHVRRCERQGMRGA